MLLSFSGWTLLSTEKKKCACNKGQLQDIMVDVLVQTNLKTHRNEFYVNFYIGVQSDDQGHLERHYSYKEKSARHDGLIIIHTSGGSKCVSNDYYSYQNFGQAEEFQANRMAEILEKLVDSFR